jgi:hypothetical protein
MLHYNKFYMPNKNKFKLLIEIPWLILPLKIVPTLWCTTKTAFQKGRQTVKMGHQEIAGVIVLCRAFGVDLQRTPASPVC